jgi:LysM repeat protein
MSKREICPLYKSGEEGCETGTGYVSNHDVTMIINYCTASFRTCPTYEEASMRNAIPSRINEARERLHKRHDEPVVKPFKVNWPLPFQIKYMSAHYSEEPIQSKEVSMPNTIKNKGWSVVAAGLAINLALGILYTWSIFKGAIVDSITDLRVLADAAGTSIDVIQDLNPHLRAATPNVDEYVVYVPKGTRAHFETALAAIPPSDRVNFIEHRISSGENLSVIAARYGTRVSALQEVNNITNPRRLQIGQRIVIPVGEPGRYYSSQPLAGHEVGEQVTYRVQRGDSLAQIATNYRTNVASLMDWNGLTSTLIYPGDRLVVYYGTRGAAPRPQPTAAATTSSSSAPAPMAVETDTTDASRNLYTVRRGDNLYIIAQRFNVSVEQLKSWNNRRGNLIHPGDKLVVYTSSPLVGDPDVAQPAHNLVRHTVQRGDAPYVIAQRYSVSLNSLLAANGLTRSSRIYPGDVLVVPGATASQGTAIYTVRRGDTPAHIAQSHGVALDELLRVNGLTRRSVIYPGDQLTIPGR